MAENFVNIIRDIRGSTNDPATDTSCIYGDMKNMHEEYKGFKQITDEERLKLENIEEGATKNSTDAFLLSRANHTGTMSMAYTTDSSSRFAMTINDKNKLDGMIPDATKNDSDANLRNRATHTGFQSIDTIADSSTHVKMTSVERNKLEGIQANATKNATDAELRNRSTHTGTQSADTIVDGVTNAAFTNAEKVKLAVLDITKPPAHLHNMNEITFGNLDASRITESSAQQFVTFTEKERISGSEQAANRGVPNGYAPLDGNGKINPSYLDSLNIIDVFTPVDFDAMLLLSSANPGDIAYVQESQDTYMLIGLPSNNQLNWKKLNSAAGVISINGLNGVVSMSSDDLPEGTVNKYFTGDRVANEVKDFIKAGTNITVSYDSITNKLTISSNKTSTEWSEIQNKPSPNISVEITGDASGSANTTLTNLANGSIQINDLTLKDTGTAGTYRKITTDSKGRVISGEGATTIAEYEITDAYTKTEIDGLINNTKTDIDTLDSTVVKLTGDQTIKDVKTFMSSPIVPIPTAVNQVANKNYVDVSISNLDIGVPSGAILMWSGSIATIPSGWALCNGANGTPDLRNRFVMGAGSTYDVGVTGGSKDAIVVAHTHTGTAASGGGSESFMTGFGVFSGAISGGYSNGNIINYGSTSAHTHNVSINSTGSSGTDANLPPYFALAYIMKL